MHRDQTAKIAHSYQRRARLANRAAEQALLLGFLEQHQESADLAEKYSALSRKYQRMTRQRSAVLV